jgi:hypothetical protein
MRYHNDVFSWIDVKVGVCFPVMVDRNYQMDELQSVPIMVKSLMGRCFAKSKWLSG